VVWAQDCCSYVRVCVDAYSFNSLKHLNGKTIDDRCLYWIKISHFSCSSVLCDMLGLDFVNMFSVYI